MLSSGILAKRVQERLGHFTIAITMDTSSRVIPAMEEEATAKVAVLDA